jgi:hypothetical protein
LCEKANGAGYELQPWSVVDLDVTPTAQHDEQLVDLDVVERAGADLPHTDLVVQGTFEYTVPCRWRAVRLDREYPVGGGCPTSMYLVTRFSLHVTTSLFDFAH